MEQVQKKRFLAHRAAKGMLGEWCLRCPRFINGEKNYRALSWRIQNDLDAAAGEVLKRAKHGKKVDVFG